MNLVLLNLALTTAAIFTGLWLMSLRMRDVSIVDIWWGPGIALLALLAAWQRPPKHGLAFVFLAAVTLWGLRLGWHILQRHDGEDSRYARMRAARGEGFARQSLITVFLLQAVVQFFAASPGLTGMLLPGTPNALVVYAGLALFVTGFSIEAIADHQLQAFRANPANKGQLMRSGLYASIRHPNYLGEFILQAGLGIAAYGLSGSLWAFLGPVLMITLVVFVSGPPLQEESLRQKPGHEEWIRTTGRFLPKLFG